MQIHPPQIPWQTYNLLGGLFIFIIRDIASSTVQQRTERIFEKGDKNGKLLALLTAVDKPLTVVPCISSTFGVLLTDRDAILQTLI